MPRPCPLYAKQTRPSRLSPSQPAESAPARRSGRARARARVLVRNLVCMRRRGPDQNSPLAAAPTAPACRPPCSECQRPGATAPATRRCSNSLDAAARHEAEIYYQSTGWRARPSPSCPTAAAAAGAAGAAVQFADDEGPDASASTHQRLRRGGMQVAMHRYPAIFGSCGNSNRMRS